MRKLFLSFFILIPALSFAQLEVMGGLGFLVVRQQGIIITTDETVPNYFQATPIERRLFTFGETMTAFYRLKFPSLVPKAMSIGPQFGVGFYYTRLKKATDPNFRPDPSASGFKRTFGPCHIPLEFAVRFGSLSNPDLYSFGISFSAGMDFLYLHVADEKAFGILPCGSIAAVHRKTGFRIGFHFLKFNSVYDSNLGDVKRLSNTLTSFELVRTF